MAGILRQDIVATDAAESLAARLPYSVHLLC